MLSKIIHLKGYFLSKNLKNFSVLFLWKILIFFFLFICFSHPQLVLISNKETRTLLHRWCSEPLLSINELKLLAEINCPYLLPCISDLQCPQQYRWFVKDLSCASPISALIPCDAVDAIQSVIDAVVADQELDPLLIRSVSDKAPFVYRLISEGAITQDWVIKTMRACVALLKPLQEAVPHDFPDVSEALPYAYLPNLLQVRTRGLYTADKQKGEKVCNKYHNHHKALLPGIFTIHCQHGKFYFSS